MPASNKTTRTIQFRVKDVRFYHNGVIISNNSPLPVLLQANGVALCIDNQKNGTRGETIFHHAMPGFVQLQRWQDESHRWFNWGEETLHLYQR